MKSKFFLILNGPNLNMLGFREPEIYGHDTLSDIQNYTESQLDMSKIKIEWFQSNIEGAIVEKIQKASLSKNLDAIIINPAAYSHTSVAILDALMLIKIPIIEVHLTNTHRRESFRQRKLTAKASTIIMEGLGKSAYLMAIKTQLL
jgi:3-dehydroquinate dehydratase II